MSQMFEPFTAACVQLNSGTNVDKNVADTSALVRDAAKQGASYIQTPEMTTILHQNRKALMQAISPQDNNSAISAFSKLANELNIWLHIGSMAVELPKAEVPTDKSPQIANRGFLFGPDGRIAASYDKIHMFDVDLDNGESWRESALYRPGETAMMADLEFGAKPVRLGMAICYDVRFAHLFRTYAQNGALVLGTPAAFTKQTGEAHWHILQRARAIEHGAFMISAAQAGLHEDGRETFGHSIIVDPWGTILAESNGTDAGVITAKIDPQQAIDARKKIPALVNDRTFQLRTNSAIQAT
ncbi:MAG: carbon-nitrogen hydrolase family protein [Rhizobiales bacterium]|nr:carbon-nitrogen hydrolase family protein [Hyphomicrobiales bacterium]